MSASRTNVGARSSRVPTLRSAIVLLQILLLILSAMGPGLALATDGSPDPSAPPASPTADPTPTPTPDPTPDPTPEATPDPTPEPTPDPAPAAPSSYIATFAAGTSNDDQLAAIAAAGGSSTDSIPQLRMHAVDLTTDALAALRATASVVRVESDRTRSADAAPSDPGYASQWSLTQIGWDQLFGTTTPSGSAVVALLDTGVDASHPDLAGQLVGGTSILDGGSATSDPNGHGTAMAGIIAAATDNATGVAGVGYAGVKVMPVTVLDADGLGQDSDVIAGVVWATDNGADVINMSFSNPGFSAALQAAIDYAWDNGVVLVAALGNDGSTSVNYPAGDRGVVGVSSTDQGDALAAGSNFGEAAFLGAPGTDILTLATDGGTSATSGTSASSAAVAAAAALLLAADPSASNGQVVARLAVNADAAGTVDQTGNGRLNLARAMADTSTDSLQPNGAGPVGDGGPFVGPYNANAINAVRTMTPLGVYPSSTRHFAIRLEQTSGATNDLDRTRCITTPLLNFTSIGDLDIAAPAGKTWVLTSSLVSGNPVLKAQANTDADKLMPNDVVTMYFSATAPAALGDNNWISTAWTNGTVASAVACSTNAKTFNGTQAVLTLNQYTMSASPATVAGGVSTTFTATFTETGTDKKGKQLEMVLPKGWTFGSLVSATASGGAGSCTSTGTWVAGPAGIFANGRIELEANTSGAELCVATPPSDPTGGVLTVVFTATPAASTNGTYFFIPYMHRDGNEFALFGSEYSGTVDSVVPTVLSITRVNTNPTTATGVSWTVQFSENVTGVDLADFALVQAGGVSGAGPISVLAVDGDTYTVSAGTGTGNGTLGLNLNDNDSITDAAANKLGGTGTGTAGSGGAGNGSFTGEVYTVDKSTSTALTSDLNPSTYGDSVTFTATVSSNAWNPGTGNGTVTFFDGVNPICSNVALVSNQATCTTSTLNAATHSITATYSGATAGGLTWNPSTSSALSQVVNPKSVTVTPDSGQTKVYGNSDPALTYTLSSPNGGVSGALARASGQNVGLYAINLGTLTSNDANYTLVLSGTTVNFSITARPIEVTATAGQNKVYGDADPTFAYTVTSGSLAGSDSFTGALSRAAGQNVGLYAITLGTLAISDGNGGNNYDLSLVSADFEITQRAIEVTANAGQNKVYGDADPTLTYSVTSGALQYSDAFTGALDRAPGDDVGLYAITLGSLAINDGNGGANYDLSFVGADFEITQRDITGNFTADDKVYDGNTDAVVLTRSLNNTVLGDDVELVGGFATFADANAGTWTVTLTGATLDGADAGNYNLTSVADTTANISQAGSITTVTCAAGPFTYSGSPQEPCTAAWASTSTDGGGAPLTVTYLNNTNAGLASASATFAGDANHTGSGDSETFTIDKADTTTTVTCAPGPFTYSGAAQEPCTAAWLSLGADGEGAPLTVTYTDNVNAGTATGSATFAGDANHNGSADTTDFTIDKAATSTTVSCPTNVTYSGSPQEPCTASATGPGGLNQALTVNYTDNVNAGLASASATYAESANYLGSSDTETFTIDKAATTTTVTCPASVTYDGDPQEPCSASVTGPGALNQSLTVTYLNNVNSGTATASATYDESANYLGSSDTENFTIEPTTSTTTVTCPAGPYTYNGDPQEPCSASVTGDGGLNQSLTVTYTDNVNAGQATASASYAGDANHSSSFDSENFTIDPAGSTTTVTCPTNVTYTGSLQTPCSASWATTGDDGEGAALTVSYSNNVNAGTASASAAFLGDANHTGSLDDENFTIDKASSTTVVTCTAGPFTYNGSAHEPCSVSVTGAGGLSLTPAPSYSNNVNAGTATASYTYAGDANHNISNDSENFTIDQASSTVDLTCPASVTYTGSAQEPCSATVTGAGGLNESVAVTYMDNVNAGTATANASFAGDANHEPNDDTETFVIDPAGSTTTVSCPTNVTYSGSAQEPCSASVTGAGGLNQPLTVNYTNNTNAGTATASASFAGDANHTGSSDSENFTIDKAGSTTTVTCGAGPFTYTGTAQTPCSASVTGPGGLNQSLTVNYSNNTNAGTATASATYAESANYFGSTDSENFTIGKANTTTTVTCGAGPFTYTGTAQTPCSASVTGPGGLNQSLTVSYSNNVNAGTATASATYAESANYFSSTDSENFTIGKAMLNVNAVGASKTAGNPDPPLTYTLSGFVNSETPTSAGVTGSAVCTRAPGETPGNYTITCNPGTLNAANYNFQTGSTATFTINAAGARIEGFYTPVDMTPSTASSWILNSVKGGQTVPLKFRLYASDGSQITSTGGSVTSLSVVTYLVSCPGSAYVDPEVLPTVATGGTSLRYDGSHWIFNWTVPKAAGKCYEVTVNADGNTTMTGPGGVPADQNGYFKSK